MKERIADLIKGKKIRDKKDGEDFDELKLQKKVKANEYMMFRDAFIDTVYFVTRSKIISCLTEEVDKSAVIANFKAQLKTDKENKKITEPILWFKSGDTVQEVYNFLGNFLRT